MFDKLFYPSYTTSMEMIEQQLNDEVVVKLNSKFQKLIELADRFSTKIVTSVSFFRFPETKKIIDDIDAILLERFKFNTKHVSGDGIGYAVLTVPPVNLNVVAGDVESKFKYFKQLLGKDKQEYDNTPETTEKDVKDRKYIKDIFKDEKSIIYHTYISYLKLEETLKSRSVKVDLKKATITGLPKDYNLFMIADFYMLIKNYKMTASELTAILLHEIGHGFTHIEYSYRTVQNTTLILDTIKDNITNGKSRIDTFNLIYNTTLEGNDDLTKYNENVAAIKVLDRYMQVTLNMHKDDRHSYTDSEQLADQFANKFGVGASLITSLNKLHGDDIETPRRPNTIALICFMALLMITVGLIFLPMVLTYILVYAIMTIIFGGSDANATTYDKKLRRYQRVRNDIVKLIRSTDIDKNIIRNLLEELDTVDKIISEASSDTSLLDKLGDVLLPWNRKVSNFQKLEELLEDMSENNLYVLSNKIKTLKF